MTSPSPPSDPSFPLSAWLERLGLDERPGIDAHGLARVVRAQQLAIPFENLDVVLGRGVRLDTPGLTGKLLDGGRGGYCFECNRLLREGLRALGFEARSILARVVIHDTGHMPARTHAIVEVGLPGGAVAVDAGFGRATPAHPVPLPDIGAAAPPMRVVPADAHLAPGPDRWFVEPDPDFGLRMRQARADGTVDDLYVFDRATVHDVDLEVGNHWTSTHPSSFFTHRPIATRTLPEGRRSLDARAAIDERAGERTMRTLDDADELVDWIRDGIGLRFDPAPSDRTRLWACARRAHDDRPGG